MLAVRIAIEIPKSQGMPTEPGAMPENCPTIHVLGDEWVAMNRKEEFGRVFGATRGSARQNQISLDIYGAQQQNQPILSLNSYYLDARDKTRGVAFCDVDPRQSTHYLNYTHYWRVVNPRLMSMEDRKEEVGMLMAERLIPELQAKLGPMFTLSSGAMLVILGIMLACPLAIVVRFACLLVGAMSLKIMQEDMAVLDETNRVYREKMTHARKPEDLEEAASAACQWWIALVEFLLAAGALGGIGSKAYREVTKADAERAAAEARTGVEPAKQGEASKPPRRVRRMADWRQPYKDYLEKADKARQRYLEAERKGDLAGANKAWLECLEHAIDAETLFAWERSMDGHAQVVVDVGKYINNNLLAKIRNSSPVELVRVFQGKNIELTMEEAQYLVRDAQELKTINFDGHDMTGEYAKSRGNIADGMKFPGKAASPDFLKVWTDKKSTPEQILQALNKEPHLRSWLENGRVDAVNRAIKARQAITLHNREPHHSPTTAHDWWEKGVDSAQSQVMVERTYQGTKSLAQIGPFKTDSARIRSVILLGKYALMEYVETGKGFKTEDISRCGNLSKLERP